MRGINIRSCRLSIYIGRYNMEAITLLEDGILIEVIETEEEKYFRWMCHDEEGVYVRDELEVVRDDLEEHGYVYEGDTT
jgi:outer membrane protein assembly factor BamA